MTAILDIIVAGQPYAAHAMFHVEQNGKRWDHWLLSYEVNDLRDREVEVTPEIDRAVEAAFEEWKVFGPDL